MAMDLNAKAAYIRGLMTGMEFDPNSKNGKIIAAMMDLLEAMAATVTEHDQALDQAFDELDAIDEDMDDLTDALFGIDDEDEEDESDDDEAEYEVTCPNCGAPVTRLGSKFCEYCGSGLREISVRVWSINKITEIL